MDIAYKLVDQEGFTRRGFPGETQWLPVGSVVHPVGEGTEACGPGVLHAYATPEIGVLMNPVHADISNPRCLRVGIVGDGEWESDGMKRWTTSSLTILDEIKVPKLHPEDLAAWAIVMAPHSSIREWAIGWLSGEDRTCRSAKIAQTVIWGEWKATATQRAVQAAHAVAEARGGLTEWRTAEVVGNVVGKPAWVGRVSSKQKENFLMAALTRARAILAGKFPAEMFDQDLTSNVPGDVQVSRT